MDALFQLGILPALLIPLLLIVFRVAGVLLFLPVYNGGGLPGRVKILLALAISCCLWSSIPHMPRVPDSLGGMAVAAAGEMSVGLMMGLLCSMIFTALRLAANMLGQQMGLALPSVYDPQFQQQSTSLEQMANWIGVLVFLGLGGQRQLVLALVYSYRDVPMGHAISPAFAAAALVGALQAGSLLAINIAAPALAAFFLSLVTMAVLSKSVAQINLMTISMPINLLIGLGVILLGLSGWAAAGQSAWNGFFLRLGHMSFPPARMTHG